ncbi:hypothetical protein [Methylomonas sp. 11b]|uniref:hypothetical protein n=1 Tax=Methylomonas sp. 11b TaxID=1168169 RepID=UPI00047A668E|nr:hypothetical protein [Methylomonas sp. 11b]
MRLMYEAKLDIPVGAVSPDTFHDSHNEQPNSSFVVSRHRNGSVASVYGDNTWNLSAYHPEEKPRILSFEFWDNGEITFRRKELMDESRQILFLLMWLRNGPSLSIGTLQNYLTTVNALARFCDTNKLSIRDLLGDEKKLWNFVELQKSGWIVQSLGSLLPQLTNYKYGFTIVGHKFLQAIRTRGMQYRDTLSQHSPIPTRIYSIIISQLTLSLSDWDKVAEDMLITAEICRKNPFAGRSVRGQFHIARKLGIPYRKNLTFPQLASEICLKYITENGLNHNVKSLSTLIAETQLAAKLTIQLFTGMRDDEAFSLPYNCIETKTINGIEHYIVLGRTTKLNNSRKKQTRWVTNAEAYKAIKTAQKIAESIYSTFGVNADDLKTNIKYYPLFVSVGYLSLAGGSVVPEDGRFRPNKIDLSRMPRFRKTVQPLIQEEDVCELEQIDPHRAWRADDKFSPGNAWTFTSHQLRRSLALYAQRSGLVSLPSLRRQLQHITNEMSLYYAKGSIYAKNFIGNDKLHFGALWQETMPESEGLSYILNVLLSDDILFGGHASWIKNRIIGVDGEISFDREKTLQQFKRGEIAYRETLLGGCTSTETCKQPALKWINTDCLQNGCKNLVCNINKLERVIAAQEKLVSSLDKNLVEYRTEQADLDILISARNRAIKIDLNNGD